MSGGAVAKKSPRAARPPAEAPIPTMGKAVSNARDAAFVKRGSVRRGAVDRRVPAGLPLAGARFSRDLLVRPIAPWILPAVRHLDKRQRGRAAWRRPAPGA